MKKNFIFIGLVLFVFLFQRSWQIYLHSNLKYDVNKVAAVEIAYAKTAKIKAKIEAVGLVEPFQKVDMQSSVSGIVQEIKVTEGTTVEKDELLLTLDPRPFQAALEKSLSALNHTQALLKNAKNDAKRIEELINRKLASAQEYDKVIANQRALEAQMKENEADIQLAQLKCEYAQIRAPFRGRVGEIKVYPGAVVAAEKAQTLISIHQIEPIFVRFSVPERHLSVLRELSKANRLEVYAKNPENNKVISVGYISMIDNEIKETTGAIMLKAQFDNKKEKLWPGQYVDVQVPTVDIPNAVTISENALQSGEKGHYVYVVDKEDIAHVVDVKTAFISHGIAILEGGLKVGDKVVVEGQFRLEDGRKVEAR